MRKRIMVLCVTLGLALSSFTGASAVVNGSAAQPGQFPFMASIQDRDGFAYCGGSVIARYWVLTAAHCAEGSSPQDVFVVTGKTDLSEEGGQRLAVTAIHIHPRFNTNLDYDAALLRLATPTRSPAIRLAGSADDDLEVPGRTVTVAGWGDTLPTLGLFATNRLQHVDLKVVSDNECGQTNFGLDGASGVCAAALLKDSCNGDSGGPLFAPKAGRLVQLGIVSYGQSCALPKFPGVYSEINNAAIRSWIRAVARV